MAPSRRKGASKAAVAAAACSKWKIGDLVLAKVKGFPAWPARVSVPKDWGFKEDLKKVFVYFFGTEQIAFCTPADVELFTEEKKASLLGKRHGKGADFSRAVNEIIDCYEELKKEEPVVDGDCPNEMAEVNDASSGFFPDNNMVESLHKSRLKEEDIAPVLGHEMKIAESTGDDSDFTSLADAAVSELEKSNMLAKEPSFNVVVTYSSRRKLENMQIPDCVTQGRAQPVRRSRSSRVDTSRLETLMTFRAHDSSNGDMASNISRDRTGRRSKRSRRSPDGSGRRFIASPALISNGSIDENGAVAATISDCSGFNDEIDVDSTCKSMATEAPEHGGPELEHSRRIDFQTNASIFRKKRKPSRKRTGNETIELTAGIDKVEKNGHALPSEHVKLSDHISKENGDEHLPLVKRARARMGSSPCQLPSAGEGEQTDCQSGDKMFDVSKESFSLNCEENDSANCNSLTDRENDSANSNSHTNRECGNLSPLNVSASKKLQSWEVKKTQPFSSLVDGEAALPPSKRLHRALEAMSANAAEDVHTSSDHPAVLNASVNGHSSSYSGVCHTVTVDSSVGVEVGSSDDAPMPDPSIADESVQTPEELAANGGPSDKDDHPIGESCHDAVEAMESENSKQDLNVFSVGEFDCGSPGLTMHDDCKAESSESSPGCKSPGLARHLNDDCKAESTESAKTSVEPDSRCVDMSLDQAKGKESSPVSLQQDTNSHLISEEKVCIGTVKLPEISSDEVKLNCTMDDSFEKGAAVKATATTHQEEHVGKAVSTTRASPTVTDGLDSGQRHPSPAVCDISLPIKTNSVVVNNIRCSPEDLQIKIDKSTKASSKAEPSDALESFKAVLGTLTRSREIIARATQIAIDCAKTGTASKVVEILTRDLEKETSLHRRVDLFFLVDSITQCSQGMKGILGGVFQQAIQSVLSRLISAAAPPGSSAQENRRQCLKVLRVWLEKRIFPESIIRHHIRELDALCCSSSAGISSRSLKTERAFDDPIRQMEGMMVDEYGSNSSIQLPGFSMPPMMTDGDGGSDSDEENFEAVTPEHNTEYREGSRAHTVEKHPHILEDVDGELEMEDVAPSCEADTSSMHLVSPAPPLSLPPPPTIPDSATNLLQPKLHSTPVDMNNDIKESFRHRSTSSRGNSFRHHGPDRRDFHGHNQSSSSSYNSQHVSYPLGPHHPPPADQFPPYAHSDQRMPYRRDVPPNPHRYHMAHCSDDGNFFRDRGRMKHVPRDVDDCWRSPAPPYSGPCHPDFPRRSHDPVSYSGPPREPAFPNHRWSNPPRGMNHREYMPHRPPPGGPIHAPSRGSNYWRPR